MNLTKGATVTISKQGNQAGSGSFCIKIEDEASRETVVEVYMGLADFAEALGGLGCVKANYIHLVSSKEHKRLGKGKETKSVSFPKELYKDVSYSERREYIRGIISELLENREDLKGWSLWSDGASSQQPTENHQFIVARWVEVEE